MTTVYAAPQGYLGGPAFVAAPPVNTLHEAAAVNGWNHWGAGWSASAVLLAIVMWLAWLLIKTLIVLVLWNAVLPRLWPSVPRLDFWTALGITLLITVLF